MGPVFHRHVARVEQRLVLVNAVEDSVPVESETRGREGGREGREGKGEGGNDGRRDANRG